MSKESSSKPKDKPKEEHKPKKPEVFYNGK
jgi:hypothetical protein